MLPANESIGTEIDNLLSTNADTLALGLEGSDAFFATPGGMNQFHLGGPGSDRYGDSALAYDPADDDGDRMTLGGWRTDLHTLSATVIEDRHLHVLNEDLEEAFIIIDYESSSIVGFNASNAGGSLASLIGVAENSGGPAENIGWAEFDSPLTDIASQAELDALLSAALTREAGLLQTTGEPSIANEVGGTGRSDSLVSGRKTAVYGLVGDDTLTAAPSAVDQFLFGGPGDDLYVLDAPGTFVVSDERGTDTIDVSAAIEFREFLFDAWIVEDRHLLISSSGGGARAGANQILIVDYEDSSIERLVGRNSTELSLSTFVEDATALNALNGNVTWENYPGSGLSDPTEAGLRATLDVALAREGDLLTPSGQGLSKADAETVAYLYEAALDRNGTIDLPGLNFWIDSREDGQSELELSQAFLVSDEFENAFGDPDTLSNRALVDVFYRNVLDREGEAAGVNFWTGVLDDNPTYTRSQLLLDFALSPENREGSAFVNTLNETFDGFWDFA